MSSRCEYNQLYLYYVDESRKELFEQQSGVNTDFAGTMYTSFVLVSFFF